MYVGKWTVPGSYTSWTYFSFALLPHSRNKMFEDRRVLGWVSQMPISWTPDRCCLPEVCLAVIWCSWEQELAEQETLWLTTVQQDPGGVAYSLFCQLHTYYSAPGLSVHSAPELESPWGDMVGPSPQRGVSTLSHLKKVLWQICYFWLAAFQRTDALKNPGSAVFSFPTHFFFKFFNFF